MHYDIDKDPALVWIETEQDGGPYSVDWTSRAVFWDGEFFRLMDDFGDSRNGPFEDLDKYRDHPDYGLPSALILSPAWEGWKENLTDLKEALAAHQNSPEWLKEIP